MNFELIFIKILIISVYNQFLINCLFSWICNVLRTIINFS